MLPIKNIIGKIYESIASNFEVVSVAGFSIKGKKSEIIYYCEKDVMALIKIIKKHNHSILKTFLLLPLL